MKAQQRRRPAGLCVPGRQRGPEQGMMMEGDAYRTVKDGFEAPASARGTLDSDEERCIVRSDCSLLP